MTRFYLIRDYAGGMRIDYAGKHSGVAHRRKDLLKQSGWREQDFAIVRATSQKDAFEKAAPILLARKSRERR